MVELASVKTSDRRARAIEVVAIGVIIFGAGCSESKVDSFSDSNVDFGKASTKESSKRVINYDRRYDTDPSGFRLIDTLIRPWKPDATLAEIGDAWRGAGDRAIERIDRVLAQKSALPLKEKVTALYTKAEVLNYVGNPRKAYEVLQQIRMLIADDETMNREMLYSIVYLQGVAALRRGENENCIMCRGESSCILPIVPAAVHTNPDGSRLAIEKFTEYLNQFPEDLAVRWLLNLAHMTLGEHPDKVDPRFLVSLDRFLKSEDSIGKFRDIGHIVGVNHFNQAGGAIMEDFDNDTLLDIVITTMDPTGQMTLFRNSGNGTFDDQTSSAGLVGQMGGLNCVQTDYNDDGLMDIFIVRGAWLAHPIRPTFLKNNGDGTFTDVTTEAGLLDPVNSISSSWADYDNDGWVDVFICCERQQSRLYRNRGNGTFEETGVAAGVVTKNLSGCKGAAWFDYDNDGFEDLFQNFHLTTPTTKLFHNNRDGTFQEVTESQGIHGPVAGFSCWAWDYDNDGWLDIFASCFDKRLEDVVKGLLGQPHNRNTSRLYHNRKGQGFDDVSKEVGLDAVYSTMGSNFADFDNDGFLDMYLGTGEPDIATLVPNRMFKNVGGRRFSEVTGTSGTGNLQKGHGVACGDWDRDGNTDIFIEMGGAIDGDKYHDVLFQNPGHDKSWLTIKLTGQKSNRPAIGVRIKVTTQGAKPEIFFRHVTTGSSFGANPILQTIGLAEADRVAVLEIYWPASETTQVFRDIAVNQAITITEFSNEYNKLDWKAIPIPKVNANAKMTNR